jgi:hypothetical protein
MILGWINKLDRPSHSVTGSGWLDDLPLQNALVDPLGKIARTTPAGPGIVDFSLTGIEYRVLGLLNTTAGIGADAVRLTLSATAPGGTDFYDSGSLNFTNLKMKAGYAQLYIVIPPLGEGANFARLTLNTISSTPIDVGRLVLYGDDGFWEPPRNYAHGAGLTWDDPSPVLETLGGQEVARASPRRRRFDFDLPNNARDGMLNNIFELDRIAGTTGNILVMLDPVNRPVEQSLWGRLEVSTPLIETRGRMGKRFIVRERL